MPAPSAAPRDLPKALQIAGGVAIRPAAKIALRLADRMQDDLIAQGWPQGKNLGPEGETARAYRTTERVIRETMRVLEWRGVGNVRRGHSGGLVVTNPSMEGAGRYLGLYLAAKGCGSAEIDRYGKMLLREISGEQPRARQFVRTLVAHTQASMRLTAESALVPDRLSNSNRAVRISYRILQDLNGTDATLTIEDMMDRYHAGRPVLVQALRALESVELIRIVRGRSGGVARCRPTAGAMVRMVLPAFLASGLRRDEFAAILAAANIRCAIGACRGAGRMTALSKLAMDLDEAAFAQGDMAGQVRILRQIASYSGDELSHLLAGAVWYCLARQNVARPARDSGSAQAMVDVTRKLVDAVLSGNPESAGDAARELHRCLDEVVRKSIAAQGEDPHRAAWYAPGETAKAFAN